MCVDLLLAPMESTNRLVPASAMGMLWLQTHFDEEHWDELSRGLVALSPSSVSYTHLTLPTNREV